MENSPRSTDSDSKEQDYASRRVAMEANQLHGKELPPEQIGHMLMAGKTPETVNPKPPAETHVSKETIDLQRVATMSHGELLDISDEITIDSTTLRHIYDSHLIGENGLRRLIYEHMSGGNLQEALHHEILEHEAGFERDPQLRHQPFKSDQLQPSSAKPADNNQPSLNELLGKAGLTKLDPSRELTAPKLLSGHATQSSGGLRPQQRRLLDLAFVGIILILLALVIMLVLGRG